MANVREVVTFRRYIDNDPGEFLVADILPELDSDDWPEWEQKLLEAIGYETTFEVTWNTVTNEATFRRI